MAKTRKTAIGFVFSVIIGGFAPAAQAESVYIDDELRVGVRSEPDNTLSPMGVVTTGMKLDVIERTPGYMKIRTDKGLEGWIRDIYTTQNPPALLQLKQVKKEQAQLRAQLAEKDRALDNMEQKNLALFERNERLEKQIDRLKVEMMKYQPVNLEEPPAPAWTNWLLAVVVVIIAGFALGIGWQRQRTIKRLGGLRV